MTWEEISKELFEEKTEKRFKLSMMSRYGHYIGISDKDKEYTSDEVVDLLNKLSEENEQLKTDIQLHIDDREEYRKLSLQFDNRNKELISENALLEKENEHIKHTIKTMMESERTELGRSVLRQLWEAIQ